MEGLKIKEMLKVFQKKDAGRQLYENSYQINHPPKDKVGAGIYCSPHIQVPFK